MSAITYKFGVEEDITPVDSATGEMTPGEAEAAENAFEAKGGIEGLQGLGYVVTDLADGFDEELTADAINTSHAGLMSMAWLRDGVGEALRGTRFHVEFQGRNVKLVLDDPIPANMTPWNPPTSTSQRNFSLLSWTSKMGTPSFSLPAGPLAMGGSCPGAAAGMTLTPLKTLQSSGRQTAKAIRDFTDLPRDATGKVRLAQAICQHCYAEGGQYATSNVQVAQVLRYAWVREALRDGSFVPIMSWALQNANYKLTGGKVVSEELDKETGKIVKRKVQVPLERTGARFFRLHDSGDMFSPDYVRAWREVADNNPDVTIWAPSRVWVIPRLREAVNDYNSPVRNLIIRPSTYHVNDPAPRGLGPGWAAGTTVFKDTMKPPTLDGRVQGGNRPYDWDCQAYTTDSGDVTCRSARAPDQEEGCRACWSYGRGPEPLEVNYTLH